MSNKVITMQTVRSIIQLLIQGRSLRFISRELSVSRRTVTGYADKLRESGKSLQELRVTDDAALSAIVYGKQKQLVTTDTATSDTVREDFVSRVEYFTAELKRTGVTRLLLWQEYCKQNPPGGGYGYTQFCVLLKRHHHIVQPVMHFSHKPGERMMADFAGDNLHYIDVSSGELIPCPVLVCVLPYSDFAYVCALPDMTAVRLIAALNNCLDYFDGVPRSFKTDNMKQAVSKASRYEPSFTELFNGWALHNNMELLAARVGKPRDKASVENEVNIAYRRIYAPLRDKQFFSLAELNAAVNIQLDLHNQQFFQKETYSRKDLFDKEEKPLLQPLPANPFVIRHRVQAKVQRNYHITLGEDKHHYSVPFSYIGKTVTAVYDTDTVEIYLGFQRIALHPRSYKRKGYTTLKEHMPEGHRNYFEQRGWTADYFLRQAEAVGICTKQYIQQLLKGRTFTEQTYNACMGIMRLGKQYGNDRLEAACKRALGGSVYNYKTIENILRNGLDKHPLFEQSDLFKTPQHENLRGPQAYQ